MPGCLTSLSGHLRGPAGAKRVQRLLGTRAMILPRFRRRHSGSPPTGAGLVTCRSRFVSCGPGSEFDHLGVGALAERLGRLAPPKHRPRATWCLPGGPSPPRAFASEVLGRHSASSSCSHRCSM